MRSCKPPGYWTLKRVTEEAEKYTTRTEFFKNSRSAYYTAIRGGWLDQVCSHMKRLRYPRGYWDFSRVKEEAEKYKTRTEFHRGTGSAYTAAWRHGWLEEVCPHMVGS